MYTSHTDGSRQKVTVSPLFNALFEDCDYVHTQASQSAVLARQDSRVRDAILSYISSTQMRLTELWANARNLYQVDERTTPDIEYSFASLLISEMEQVDNQLKALRLKKPRFHLFRAPRRSLMEVRNEQLLFYIRLLHSRWMNQLTTRPHAASTLTHHTAA